MLLVSFRVIDSHSVLACPFRIQDSTRSESARAWHPEYEAGESDIILFSFFFALRLSSLPPTVGVGANLKAKPTGVRARVPQMPWLQKAIKRFDLCLVYILSFTPNGYADYMLTKHLWRANLEIIISRVLAKLAI
jgi:hypothetical protein